MADEPTRERIVERPATTVVESRGSGVGVILGIIVIALVALAAYFLFVENESRETDAVVGAAQQVGDAAQDAADAAKDAASGSSQPPEPSR